MGVVTEHKDVDSLMMSDIEGDYGPSIFFPKNKINGIKLLFNCITCNKTKQGAIQMKQNLAKPSNKKSHKFTI